MGFYMFCPRFVVFVISFKTGILENRVFYTQGPIKLTRTRTRMKP